jgi:hypothetical protein
MLPLAQYIDAFMHLQVVTGLLRELNEAVTGSYMEEDPEMLINSQPKYFDDFTIIIATQVLPPTAST